MDTEITRDTASGRSEPEKKRFDDYQAVGEVVMVDVCAVCTHSRSEHLRGRLACSYVIDEQTACKCAEYVELPPTREGTLGCEHDWRGTHDWRGIVLACPRCQMEAPTDWFSTFQAVLILACTAAVILAACLVAYIVMGL